MESRRNTWIAAVRLAVIVSLVAVAAATTLSSLGLSQPVLVLGTIVVGFTTSWVRTGQLVERRVTSYPARHHVTVPVRSVMPSR